jgi:hypothetical protein
MEAHATHTATAAVPKARKRHVAKAPSATAKTKLGIYLSPEAQRQLGLVCLMERKSQSAAVEELILGHCRRYFVLTRGGPTGDSGEDRQTLPAA